MELITILFFLQVNPSISGASSVASMKSSSEAFFSPEDGFGDEADDWSTPPPFEDSSSEDEEGGKAVDPTSKHLLHRSKFPQLPKTSAAKRQQASSANKPCGCKEILEKMRRDFAELSDRVKTVETAFSKSGPRAEALSLEIPQRADNPSSPGDRDRSGRSALLFRLRWAFVAFRKKCSSKPNYLFVLLWPLLLHVGVLLLLRYYFKKFYLGS